MKKFARFFFHLSRNLLLENYRYIRWNANEKGQIRFYDRDRKNFFSISSRGFIDSVTANQIYTNNEYNFSQIDRKEQIVERYNKILSAGNTPLIVDCGANIGMSPQYFSREFPKARIVAIEPDLGNFTLATENCRAFLNIDIIRAAIGSEAGRVVIDNNTADTNAFRVSRTESSDGIEVKTVPDLFAAYPNSELFIVKVDIEGFERDMFSQNIDWIDKCDVLIVELHDWMLPNEASSASFLTAISGRNRDFLFKGESVFSIRNTA